MLRSRSRWSSAAGSSRSAGSRTPGSRPVGCHTPAARRMAAAATPAALRTAMAEVVAASSPAAPHRAAVAAVVASSPAGLRTAAAAAASRAVGLTAAANPAAEPHKGSRPAPTRAGRSRRRQSSTQCARPTPPPVASRTPLASSRMTGKAAGSAAGWGPQATENAAGRRLDVSGTSRIRRRILAADRSCSPRAGRPLRCRCRTRSRSRRTASWCRPPHALPRWARPGRCGTG